MVNSQTRPLQLCAKSAVQALSWRKTQASAFLALWVHSLMLRQVHFVILVAVVLLETKLESLPAKLVLLDFFLGTELQNAYRVHLVVLPRRMVCTPVKCVQGGRLPMKLQRLNVRRALQEHFLWPILLYATLVRLVHFQWEIDHSVQFVRRVLLHHPVHPLAFNVPGELLRMKQGAVCVTYVWPGHFHQAIHHNAISVQLGPFHCKMPRSVSLAV